MPETYTDIEAGTETESDVDTESGTDTDTDADIEADTGPVVACSLDGQQATERREWARSELVPHLETAEALDDGIALVFDAAAFDAVATHVEQEAECCSFADFRIDYERPHDTVRLEFTGPDGAADLLQERYAEAFDESLG